MVHDTQNTTIFSSRLYFGHVMHHRYGTPSHHFRYKVFFSLFNLDELAQTGKRSRLFTVDRWGALSFHRKDHGPKDGSDLKPWIAEKLRAGGYDFTLGPVILQCFPRVFGFMFNPLSIWYCYDTDKKLRSILYEVRNTFGEWRGYMLPVPDAVLPGDKIQHSCAKTFYVSPLIEMGCIYHFTIRAPDERVAIDIRQTRNGENLLYASQTGRAQELSGQTIRRALLRHPLLYLKIILGIHKEALVTLIKGAKFLANPRGPSGDVTYPECARILSRDEVFCDEEGSASRYKTEDLGQ